MIDTVTISNQLTKVEYDCLYEEFNTLSVGLSGKKLFRDRFDRNAYVTYALAKRGYQQIKLRHYKEMNYRAIEIMLRPKLLIDEGNYYELISFNELSLVRQSFNKVMGNFNLPDLFQWKVKRIDCAIDLNIDQELILKYMLLFRKSNIPSFMLIHPITQQFMDSTTNLYLCSKNVTVNFYDRYNTLLNKSRERFWECLDPNAVKNKLRLEVQYRNCSGELYQYLNTTFYRKIIQDFYNLIIGSGDYLDDTKSLKTIDSNVRSTRKSIELKSFVKHIIQEGSVWKAKEQFILKSENRTKAIRQFSGLLNTIRDLNINPVCLPKEWGMQELENLEYKMDEYFEAMAHAVKALEEFE